MKNTLLTILSMLILAFSGITSECLAQCSTVINDANFADAIRTLYPTLIGQTGDNKLTATASSYTGTLNFSSWGATGTYSAKVKLTDVAGIECFSSATVINLDNQNLTTLPTLPKALKQLSCRNNKLTSIASFPPTLEILALTQNGLTSLPDLPPTLQSLRCGNNRLSTLPTLPTALKFLACNSQHTASPTFVATPSEATKLLSSLPTLPSELQHLDANNNKLTSLPELPSTLVWLRINNNAGLTCIPTLPANFFTTALNASILYDKVQAEPRLNVSATGINCLPNLPANWNVTQTLPATMGGTGSTCMEVPIITIDISCSLPNQSTGTATIKATIGGGVANFEYSKDGKTFQTSNMFTTLPSGQQTFYVRRISGLSCLSPVVSSSANVEICSPKTYFVSPTGADISSNGTKTAPWKTVQYAISQVKAGQGHTIQLSEGTFNETGIINLPNATNLIGAGATKTQININSYYDMHEKYIIDACTIDTSFNPAPEKFVLQVNGSNQLLSGFSIDGQNKKCHGGIYLTNGANIIVKDIKITNFNFSGIWFNKCSNTELAYSIIQNNAFGNTQSSVGNVMFWEMNNFQIHDNIIEELAPTRYGADVGSYAIKAFAPYWLRWCISTYYLEQNIAAISKKVQIFNNTLKVLSKGTWKSGLAPSITIEFFALSFQECEIYNNYINNHISLAANLKSSNGFQITKDAMRVHNNVFDLGQKYSYAIEADISGLEIDHNYINGGYYPIAQWGANKVGFIDHKIHHNVFYSPKGGQNLIHYYTYPQGFIFANNTIVDTEGISGLFRDTPSTNPPIEVEIKNNIFSSTITNRGDLFVDTNFKNASISKNIFFNIDAFGTDVLITDPKLKNEGQKPTPYFELNTGSLAIDAGQVIAGITDGFIGTSPDIGAYELSNLILKNEPEENNVIVVFPNPNKGHEIIVKGIKSKVIIELYTTSGLNIPVKQRIIDSDTVIVDVVDKLKVGVYFLVIRDNVKQTTKKIIISNE